MKHKIRNNRNKLLKTFIQYGLHLWFIIFLCNIVVVYAVRFFLFADTDTPITPTLMPKPTGPVVSIDLILPGISSEGGNLKPLHPERDATINLYVKDLNTADKKNKPAYSIKTKVNFDDDPKSPTYTQFINPNVDLGNIANGKYQITIRTSQTLSSVIKEPGSSALGGKIYDISGNNVTTIPAQKMISGDIYTAGNNDDTMDINDYNMLVNCFNKNNKCTDSSQADLDDNGVVNGVDYNIMLLSFNSLKSLGYPVPAIITPTPKAIPTKTVPVSNVQKQVITPAQEETKSSGSAGVFITLFIVLLILGIGGFIFFKLHLYKILLKRDKQVDQTLGEPTDQPVDQSNESAGESSSEPSNEESTDVIEKSGYLKKTSADSETNGTWVTIADDNGISRALYTGANVIEGFVKIKGTMKTDKDNKQYILISELKAEE